MYFKNVQVSIANNWFPKESVNTYFLRSKRAEVSFPEVSFFFTMEVTMKEIKITGTQEFFGKNIPVIEGGFSEEQRIMTVQQIAVLHDMKSFEINRLITENEKEFEEGIDILNLLSMGSTHAEINKTFDLSIPDNTKNFFILSEQGYMALIGLMRTERSREIRLKVRREYFSMREVLKDSKIEKALLLYDIFEGGETAVIASRRLVDLEVKKVEAELKPKADLIDYLSSKPGSLRFQEMAQLLKMSKGEFEYKLKRLRILKPLGCEVYSDYHVTRKYFEKGLSEAYANPTWYVTQKGSVWLAKKFKEMDDKRAW